MTTPIVPTQRALFCAQTCTGEKLELIAFEPGGCAILKDARIVEACDGSTSAIDALVGRFLRMIRQESPGESPPPPIAHGDGRPSADEAIWSIRGHSAA